MRRLLCYLFWPVPVEIQLQIRYQLSCQQKCDRLLTAVIEESKKSDGKTFSEERLLKFLHELPDNFHNHLQFSTYHINDYNRVCYLISLVNEETNNHFPKISDNPNAGDISNDKWKSITWPSHIDNIMR